MNNIRTTPVVYINPREITWLIKIFIKNGLTKPAAINFALRLRHLETHHGCKFVVNKLKEIGSLILSKGKPLKGDYKPVFDLSRRKRLGLRKSLRIIRCYGRWEKVRPTYRDHDAFVATVMCSPLPVPEQLSQISDEVVRKVIGKKEDLFLATCARKESRYRMTYPKGPKKSPVVPFHIDGATRVRNKITPAEHVTAALRSCPGIMAKHYDLICSVVLYAKPDSTQNPLEGTVGVISALTKDGGLKVRYVANPLMLLQTVLTRLKMACRLYLEQMPESNVFDQDSGVTWVKDQFTKGYSLTSLDLSSCSDLLPAGPQFRMLSVLFPGLRKDIELFHDVSRSFYLLSYEPGYEKKVRWTIGQPLGTEPSFFCFTIFLIWIVRSCGGDAKTFRVVGDDLIMRSELTERVTDTYAALKVPINLGKSLFNSKIGEFTGRFVDVHGSLKVFKGSKLKLHADPLGMIRQYGYSGITLIPGRYRKMIAILSLLPPPLGLNENGRIFPRIPAKTVNLLYGPRFKKLKRPCSLGSSIELRWIDSVLPYANYRVSATGLCSRSVVQSLITKVFPDYELGAHASFYSGAFLPKDILCSYTGVGSWLVKAMKTWDPNLDESVLLFNELVKQDKAEASHEALMHDIYVDLKVKTSDTDREIDDQCYIESERRKLPLYFLRNVWKRIKWLFPGRFRMK